MKRKSLLLTALLGLIVLFNSCEKDVTTSAIIVDETKTATLKVYAKAELDPDSNGLENVPDGTTFNVSIRKNDLNGNFNGSGRWTASVTVSGGSIELDDIPATTEGVTVFVDAVAFERNYILSPTVTEKRKYEYNGAFAGVLTGSNNVYTINMIPTTLDVIVSN